MSQVPGAALEVFRHRVTGVAEEMGAELMRSAFSANIKERRDYSCAVFDGAGRLLAQAAHIPVHLGAMPASVAAARRRVRAWRAGDVVVLNDPYQGGSHLPDITTVSAVCDPDDGHPIGYLATRAHHADVGGGAPGSLASARDLAAEGLVVPPVYLARRGRPARDVIQIICANSRTPGERAGDLAAQLATHRVGEERLRAIARDRASFDALSNALRAYSAGLAHEAFAALGDCAGHRRDVLDDDGLGSGPIAIEAQVVLDSGRLEVDFAGSDPQCAGNLNAPFPVTCSAVYYVAACLAPLVPCNEGLLGAITVRAPEGSVVHPRRGAAVAGGNVETSQRIVDVVLGALAAAGVPVPAASQGTMNNVALGGISPDGISFAYYETLGGGGGGGPDRAGPSAVQVHMTNTRNTPIEALEASLPLRVRRYAVRAASGGDGARRGGDGLVRSIELLAPMDVTLLTDRRVHSPWGLAGGGDGRCGENCLLRAGQWSALPAKGTWRGQSGDVIEIRTPGGGGWGARAATESTPAGRIR